MSLSSHSFPLNNLRGEFHTDYPLARYTSWRCGGKAERFYRPADLQDLQGFLAQLPDSEPLTWIGLGSNTLVRDGGIKGTVILTLAGLQALQLLDDHTLRAEAGVTCAKVSKLCVKEGFEDGAFFAGIPGTVGGALAMNAGAFGGETWSFVSTVETMNHQGRITVRKPEEFAIAYRTVKDLLKEYFVAGTFRFTRGDSGRAKQAIQRLLKQRNETQPIGLPSCGSVFKNPPGDFAGRLIQAAGLKGFQYGGAQVSKKHANFIINIGGATAHDIEYLIHYVAKTVHDQFGIMLVPECKILGI
ncbi:MAG TPA: UDP-N-acetylmuramate dehydrogenase [Coxiellaceae bacterium]|nr:UDP-N-acetylmuramate dehydrogenase [Coxiellaceae bacterium]